MILLFVEFSLLFSKCHVACYQWHKYSHNFDRGNVSFGISTVDQKAHEETVRAGTESLFNFCEYICDKIHSL